MNSSSSSHALSSNSQYCMFSAVFWSTLIGSMRKMGMLNLDMISAPTRSLSCDHMALRPPASASSFFVTFPLPSSTVFNSSGSSIPVRLLRKRGAMGSAQAWGRDRRGRSRGRVFRADDEAVGLPVAAMRFDRRSSSIEAAIARSTRVPT